MFQGWSCSLSKQEDIVYIFVPRGNVGYERVVFEEVVCKTLHENFSDAGGEGFIHRSSIGELKGDAWKEADVGLEA